MDQVEALGLLAAALEPHRQLSYADLVGRIGQHVVLEQVGASGASYQIEIEVVWDSDVGGAVRAIGSIDDGGWRAIVPLTADFIMGSDGLRDE
ncbi:MAG: hypothetical protein MUO23_11005 [Anaerolineales bacterium]|nr:hypothetical protein [Anaerolineales bacterium]